MSKRKHRRLALGVIIGFLVVAFLAASASAGIATSPLGVRQPTIWRC